MKLLSVALIQSCNYNCGYCTMRKWLYPAGHKVPFRRYGELVPVNYLSNGPLLKWIYKFITPEDWFIKFTGGEPGLYPEIESLVRALREKGYRGMIETNGSLPLPKTDGFPRIACWHKDRPMPVYFDKIIIINNREDEEVESKIKYCDKNNIERRVVKMQLLHKGINIGRAVRRPNDRPHETVFTEICQMYSMGQLMRCPHNNAIYGDIYDMTPPSTQKLAGNCTGCGQVTGIDMWDMV